MCELFQYNLADLINSKIFQIIVKKSLKMKLNKKRNEIKKNKLIKKTIYREKEEELSELR